MSQDTIYIGNLPYGVNKADLKEMFSECGMMNEGMMRKAGESCLLVILLLVPRGTILEALVATGDNGRSKGFGTVRFSTSQEAAHAISEYNGADLDGRIIEVRYDKGPKAKAIAIKKVKTFNVQFLRY